MCSLKQIWVGEFVTLLCKVHEYNLTLLNIFFFNTCISVYQFEVDVFNKYLVLIVYMLILRNMQNTSSEQLFR